MTPAALTLAREGDASAVAAATALWRSIVGHGTEGQPGYVAPAVADVSRAGAALDMVGQHVGAETDVPDDTLREAVVRTGSYLLNSAPLLGYHAALGEGLPEGDPRVGGYSALRRSGAMSLLAPYRVRRAGAI
ncbi:MAG: hypothetical protein OXU64_07590 [Gemmatimonadota bacterium]|nr:hypothetical protein [Gemmatimonadota bacterium]